MHLGFIFPRLCCCCFCVVVVVVVIVVYPLGKGNITNSAEFNFHSDPEAAAVVLEELSCPLYLVCWELCLKHILTWVSTSQNLLLSY